MLSLVSDTSFLFWKYGALAHEIMSYCLSITVRLNRCRWPHPLSFPWFLLLCRQLRLRSHAQCVLIDQRCGDFFPRSGSDILPRCTRCTRTAWGWTTVLGKCFVSRDSLYTYSHCSSPNPQVMCFRENFVLPCIHEISITAKSSFFCSRFPLGYIVVWRQWKPKLYVPRFTAATGELRYIIQNW